MTEQIDFTVDWNKVPLLKSYSPNHVNAIHRCSVLNRELPELRKQALKQVVKAISDVFVPRGYTRKGSCWCKGPHSPADAVSEPADSGGLVRSFSQFKSRIKKELRGLSMVGSLPGIAQAVGNDGSTYIALQKSKYGTGFFVNIGVRKISSLQNLGAFYRVAGFDQCRLQSFLPDLPATHRIDEFYYVRIVEDPRLLQFLMHVIEHRVAPWLELYEKPFSMLSRLPAPVDMAKERPLPFGVDD